MVRRTRPTQLPFGLPNGGYTVLHEMLAQDASSTRGFSEETTRIHGEVFDKPATCLRCSSTVEFDDVDGRWVHVDEPENPHAPLIPKGCPRCGASSWEYVHFTVPQKIVCLHCGREVEA